MAQQGKMTSPAPVQQSRNEPAQQMAAYPNKRMAAMKPFEHPGHPNSAQPNNLNTSTKSFSDNSYTSYSSKPTYVSTHPHGAPNNFAVPQNAPPNVRPHMRGNHPPEGSLEMSNHWNNQMRYANPAQGQPDMQNHWKNPKRNFSEMIDIPGFT